MSNEPRRWVPVALSLSLLLNLFLVGVVSGRVFASFDPMRQAATHAPTFVMRFRGLPAEERARFDAAYEPHRQEVANARLLLRTARLKALGALAAPVYDRAEMQRHFDALLHEAQASQQIVNAALIDALASLNPQSRAILAGADRWQGN